MPHSTSPNATERLAQMWLRLIVALGTVGILGATLFPFAPELPGPSLADWKAEIARRVEWHVPSRGGVADLLGNVLLFVPLGFGLAGVRLARGGRRVRAVAGTCVAAAVLSAGIEVTQLLIPSRDPAVSDVLANVFGALIGATIASVAERVVIGGLNRLTADRASEFLSARKLAVAFGAYAALMFAGSLAAARTPPFGAWDAGMPLVVSNRNGVASDLLIADRAMTPDEVDTAVRQIWSGATAPRGVIGFYPLGGAPTSADATGGLPPLICRGGEAGAAPAGDRWMESADAGREVARRLTASSCFTVSAALAPVEPVRSGEFRIGLLTEGAGEQNLSILRNDAHLLVRLNSPSTGGDGGRPQFLLPYLFSDGAAHRIAVSFDGRQFRTFADGRPADAVDLSPETQVFWGLLPFRPMYVVLGRTDSRAWRLGYDIVVFAPLGLLAGLLAAATRLSALTRAMSAAVALLGPPAAMQLALAAAQGWTVDWTNVFSGTATAAAAMAVAILTCVATARLNSRCSHPGDAGHNGGRSGASACRVVRHFRRGTDGADARVAGRL